MTRFPIPETALSNHIAILGKTGAGKTSTSKLVIEHVVAEGDRVCILDPIKSDWWGITSSSDGSAPGLPFTILGGPHGSVPLPATSGKALGQLVGSGKLPLSILDMADFERAGDPKALKTEIARLTKELAAANKRTAAPPEKVVANVDDLAAAREEGQRAGIAIGIARARQAIDALRVDAPPFASPAKVKREPKSTAEFPEVLVAPADTGEVPEAQRVRLVLAHPRYVHDGKGKDSLAPERSSRSQARRWSWVIVGRVFAV